MKSDKQFPNFLGDLKIDKLVKWGENKPAPGKTKLEAKDVQLAYWQYRCGFAEGRLERHGIDTDEDDVFQRFKNLHVIIGSKKEEGIK